MLQKILALAGRLLAAAFVRVFLPEAWKQEKALRRERARRRG